MITYFLFGSEAVRTYESFGFTPAILGEEHDIFCYNDRTDEPIALLEAYDGWRDWTVLEQEDFEKLVQMKSDSTPATIVHPSIK